MSVQDQGERIQNTTKETSAGDAKLEWLPT